MKPRLLDYLVCPKDLNELKMVTWNFRPIFLSEANRKIAHQMRIEPEKVSKEVFEGVLVNHQRKIVYPIIDGIPRLLLFPSVAMKAFFGKHKARLARDLPGYQLPNFEVHRQERESSRAFQHQIFGNDTDATAADKAVVDALALSLDLMLNPQKRSLQNQLILDVGLGLGSVACKFAQNQKCEVIGMDVSHLVDAVQKSCGAYPFFNLVQASILAPPFRASTFDLAYSYGGLNRFHSPELGVAKMSEMPKRQGRLNIWFDDDKPVAMTAMQKMLMHTEKLLRPMVSHFPHRIRSYAIMSCMPIYLMHQRLFPENETQVSLVDGVRSAFSVAHQRLEVQLKQGLSDEEVRTWVQSHGYTSLKMLKERAHPLSLPLALWNCAGVEGVRA